MSIIIVIFFTILGIISAEDGSKNNCPRGKYKCDFDILRDIKDRLERLERHNDDFMEINGLLETNIEEINKKIDTQATDMDMVIENQRMIKSKLSALKACGCAAQSTGTTSKPDPSESSTSTTISKPESESSATTTTSKPESTKSTKTTTTRKPATKPTTTTTRTTKKPNKHPNITITIDINGCGCIRLPKDCTAAMGSRCGKSGIYTIDPPRSVLRPFNVYCQVNTNADGEEIDGDAWTIIQRRRDGSEDFYRNWATYQSGFGELDGDFFIGLNKLRALTKAKKTELWIKMESFDKEKKIWAKYHNFKIKGAMDDYRLISLGSYTGNFKDGLSDTHLGQKWSTKDVDNDNDAEGNCAVQRRGAWWYDDCAYSNLNGKYLDLKPSDKGFYQSIYWMPWTDGYNISLGFVEMAIRPSGD